MSEKMQTEIEKRIEETAIEIEKQAFLMAPYKETDLSDAFRAGAKFILMLPELREIREVLEWYAIKGEGPYTDAGIWRRAVYALEKLKALGIVKEGGK